VYILAAICSRVAKKSSDTENRHQMMCTTIASMFFLGQAEFLPRIRAGGARRTNYPKLLVPRGNKKESTR
jgi:hypothetical protein